MRKITALFVCIFMIFSFSGCSEPPRPDFTMLSDRLSEVNEKYHFEYFDMFLYEGAYHVYLSLASQDDVLLSMVFGENGNIDSVTVVADKEKSDSANGRKAYMAFVSAVIDSFAELTEKEQRELFEKLSVRNTDIYFTDIYESYSALRYNFVFSSDSEGVSFYCEYYEKIENLSGISDNNQHI
ncbi:MAG: hypothetical protein IKV76_09360 [Clostridia bacterium]|nr:hypothetical protein [Clostridia bacterium]